MFTGIVEELGTVISLKRGSKAAVLTIKANVIFEDLLFLNTFHLFLN